MAASLAAASYVALGNVGCDPAVIRRVRQSESRTSPRHSVWIWQFSIDGAAGDMAAVLAAHHLAAVVKTHDGTEWMASYDHVDGAIAGPEDVARVAAVFENAGVPFHAWSVVKGIDPAREAEMAAQVLDAGARSITLDLEPGEGFWAGTGEGALAFGAALRARHEFARVDVSIDPRPWKMLEVPLGEFATFCDGIRPQLYWDLFDDIHHANAYSLMGHTPEARGITPEFLVSATRELLAPFDRWVIPIGAGDPLYADAWPRFMRAAWEHQMPEVSVWRYGTTSADVLNALAEYPPMSEPPFV